MSELKKRLCRIIRKELDDVRFYRYLTPEKLRMKEEVCPFFVLRWRVAWIMVHDVSMVWCEE